jgi:hypothetical protein
VPIEKEEEEEEELRQINTHIRKTYGIKHSRLS